MHLAALSLNHQGQATRWFTTNQWVTGERWAAADQVTHALTGFSVQAKGRLAPVARWLTAMAALFQPQLQAMLLERDRHLQRLTRSQSAETVWADRNIDVLSETSANLHQRIQQLGV